ncbi:hypothetical protein RRU94_02155 [Domibacillus sp. DTU_2020_1001157_1_SI_ALB_TIR_016]|uniref:hypothetical protein n=1 Tax=Domibacillus sp. DTU_2020_1001157_1_SI_ALB_TIR_016 TaxID=3077789 RepID=UPI0028EE34CC|nr:hypothetical protein [Domibacillus sp. DTU_2020_1001157_1_SI_ALB_TIR_016]WNS78771.1 hypothetical protein RRU94_02155 [Domibacillus sp. DTU_2020_1001157_1_SI_ALB_TIR_016]
MEWSQWLQGGPFLEVSFLLELKEEKTKTIQDIINKLSKVTNKVEIVDENVDDIIDFFDRGYPYDEEDPQSIHLHSLRLRLYVYLSRKRKATLQMEMVSPNALMVDFWFYGDEFDAPEWDQIGIKKEEFTGFISFLKELYSVYEFKIGGIAIEEDVLELFGFDETYPNECYRYENLSPDYFLKEPSPFLNIIWSEKHKKLSHIPYNYKRLDKEGILIETGSFND